MKLDNFRCVLDFGCYWHVVQILMNQADFRVLLLKNGYQVVQQSDVPIEKHTACVTAWLVGI